MLTHAVKERMSAKINAALLLNSFGTYLAPLDLEGAKIRVKFCERCASEL